MVKLPKPVLWWSSEPDGSGAKSEVISGKNLWLNAEHVRQKTDFWIFKRNLFSRIPYLGRRLFPAWVTGMPTEYQDGGVLRSKTYWTATNITHLPGSSEYYFIDGNGGVSGSLSVSNTATAHWKSVRYGGMGLSPKLELGLSDTGLSTGYARAALLDYGKGYEITVEADVVAPQDPVVELEVLEPGKSRDHLMATARNYFENEFSDRPRVSFETYVNSAMSHIETFLGQRNVEFDFNGGRALIATPNQPRTVSVTVRGYEPVRLLFAIQVNDMDTGMRSVSEYMPVIVLPPRRRPIFVT